MQSIRSYDELRAWQQAMTLATEVYLHTRSYPLAEIAGLTAETRRAASSIPSHLADAWAHRSSAKEARALVHQARSALMQLETYLILGLRLEYLNREQMDEIWPLTQVAAEEIIALLRVL